MNTLPLFVKLLLFINTFFPTLIPIKTKPTGLSFDPPLGPAIPVIEIHTFYLLILLKLFTISEQH